MLPIRPIAFLLSSLVFMLMWTVIADTERVSQLDRHGAPAYLWANISKTVDGSAPAPFVRRRLLPDGARLIAAVVPGRMWSAFARTVEGPGILSDTLRSITIRLNWNPEHYPQLVSAYFIIWLSTIAFMVTAAALAEHFYEVPRALSTAWAVVACFGLLGGYSGAWGAYPYDVPNAFVFLATILGIAAKRPWWPLAFVAAVYSKETSALLILVYVALRRDRIASRSVWLSAGAMAAVFGAIQLWIQYRYPAPPATTFWYPLRNMVMMAKSTVYYSWFFAFGFVLLARLRRWWPSIPADLRWLLVILGLSLAGAVFFKGWLEERRAYFEVYPVCALIVAHWTFAEWGRQDLLRPRGRTLPS